MSVTIKNPEEITILATGGTIDKFYSVAGTMDIGEPAAKDLLDRVITDVRFDIRPLIGKDSLDMTDEDRAELTEALNAVTNDQVLITHGTDTMPETARYLVEHADLGDKVVVLTGAMQPAVMARSDAGFNLGAAIAALNLLDPGVYISMSGRIFPAESVRKDRSRGILRAKMADSARMRRGEPVSAAELAPVEGSSDLVPQEHMSQAQLMQRQTMDELAQQADEFWNVTSDYPLPAKNLYLVRVLLLVVPSLIIVYYFIRVTLFPIGAVPLVYLVMHIWLAMIYRANRSVKLVLLANAASGVAAAIMTAFFAYALVTVQGPQTLLDRVGVFYTVSLLTVMASFALEVLFSLFYSLAVRRSLRLTQKKQEEEQRNAEQQHAEDPNAEASQVAE